MSRTNNVEKGDPARPSPRNLAIAVLAMAGAAASGMIYELSIATVSGYVLGDNVTHFSVVVGMFLCAMGIGAALSRKVFHDLLSTFLVIEIWLGVFGILTCPFLLYIGFVLDFTAIYFLAMLIFTGGIGIFVGLEIPLLSRYLETFTGSRRALANVLAADYIGSLLGSVAFPLLLLPLLGLIGAAAMAGFLNVFVALSIILVFRDQVDHPMRYAICCGVILIGLISLVFVNEPLFNIVESKGYRDPIVYREQSAYQRIVVTNNNKNTDGSPREAPRYLPRRWKDDTRLFLDGHLQFSSLDEYRYHEALIHPAMALHGGAEDILIMGGGDGLAAKEIFKYPHIRSVTLVDLDSRILELAKEHPEFRNINDDALRRSNIRIIAADAFAWVRRTNQRFDIIVADFPDPHAPALARLYSHEFYVAIKQRLKPGGVFVTQSSSPYFARQAFWAVRKTLESAGFETASFHTDVPAFGDWGFHLAAERKIDPNKLRVDVATRYLTDEMLVSMFVFGKDVSRVPATVNTLNNMKLYAYYQMGDWEDY